MDIVGPAGSVSFLNDFERTYSRSSDHRIELRAGSPVATSNLDRLKVDSIFITFSRYLIDINLTLYECLLTG